MTGGTGFIGDCLAKMILDEDLDVATFDITPTSAVLEPYGSRWRHFRGELRDMSEVMTVIKESQPEVIYHLGDML